MRVGYKLYREVRDLAPAEWTPAERVVAWVIADDARDTTRISLIELPLLCHRTGLTERQVSDALRELGKRGYEFRISHGNGKDGRPVYAAKGHAREYQVPSMISLSNGKAHGPPWPLPVDNQALAGS